MKCCNGCGSRIPKWASSVAFRKIVHNGMKHRQLGVPAAANNGTVPNLAMKRILAGRMSNMSGMSTIQWIFLGRMDYNEVWNLQRDLAEARIRGEIPNTLLLLEHPPTYTLGRRGGDSDLLLPIEDLELHGATVINVDRGGQATFHGPGQLVAYPILDLKEWGEGPLRYVRTLESVLMGVLQEFGVRAIRIDKLTGVWVDNKKIAAIGLKVSRGVTMHGFALNVSTDLAWFQHIVPCGVPDKDVTSMEHLLERPITVAEVIPVLLKRFGVEFSAEMKALTREALLGSVSGVV